jgi:hypothetical protein
MTFTFFEVQDRGAQPGTRITVGPALPRGPSFSKNERSDVFRTVGSGSFE